MEFGLLLLMVVVAVGGLVLKASRPKGGEQVDNDEMVHLTTNHWTVHVTIYYVDCHVMMPSAAEAS